MNQRKEDLQTAIFYLKATKHSPMRYKYYDEGTDGYYVNSAKDLADLGKSLREQSEMGRGEVYSLWCSRTTSKKAKGKSK